jgi:hypothetical protein
MTAATARRWKPGLARICRRGSADAADRSCDGGTLGRCDGAEPQKRGGLVGGGRLFAATALARDLQLVTRNAKDFARFGVKLLNPWD